MYSLLGVFFEGLQDELANSTLQSYCEHWKEHPTKYAIAHAIKHAIERDSQQLVYETLVDPGFRKLRSDWFGVNSLRTDIQSALGYFSTVKHNLLRYYQILFLGQQIDLFPKYNISSKYQYYCQAYLQFLQLNEPTNQRENVGISRVLNRLFPMELNERDRHHRYRELLYEPGSEPDSKYKLELIDYEIGNWCCKCGVRQGQAQRYELECKTCKIRTGNGGINGDREMCSHCGGPLTYVTCSGCNTRVTLDIMWRIENGSIHPREMMVPLVVNVRRFFNGSLQDIFSLTLLQLPIMLGFSEKNGLFSFDFPGVFWIDVPDVKSPFFILNEDKKYDRQTEPLKIFEALLSRTFRPYKYPEKSLKSTLPRVYIPYSQGFSRDYSRGFSQRIARIAQEISPIVTDYVFDCLVSATQSLTHNMAIMNRTSIQTKNLVALFVDHKFFSLGKHEVITPTPLGEVLSTNLDDDGIVKVGTTVYPGDVLVGVERLITPEEMTAEDKLLWAIFGDKVPNIKDGSFVYDGVIPARVTSVDIDTSENLEGTAFHASLGKTVQQAKLSRYGKNAKARITIGLSLEQPIEVGDELYASDGSNVVICRMASGIELKILAGCSEEPDLLVSAVHPWAMTLLQRPSKCSFVQAFVRPDTFIGQHINSRATGPYALIDQQPLEQVYDDDNYNVAQVMTRDDFSWLLHRNLMDTIFELLQMHSDCVDTRINFHRLAKSDPVTVNTILNDSISPPADLVDAPGETIRYLAFLLRSLGIRVGLSEGKDFNAIRISLASPEQIRSWSYGEVMKPETINYSTLNREKDGLFCERIFGPTKDWECQCGKYRRERFKGIICDKCGVEVARSKVRRERMGHIELASPVGHIWYFKGTPSLVGLLLDLSPRNLERILYFVFYIVTNVDEEARQRELMCIDEELSCLAMNLNDQVADQTGPLKSGRENELLYTRRLDEAVVEIHTRCDREIALAKEAERKTRDLLNEYMGQVLNEDIDFIVADRIIAKAGAVVKAGTVVKQRHLKTLEHMSKTICNDIAEKARCEVEELHGQGEERNVHNVYLGQINDMQTQLELQSVYRRQRLEQLKRELESLKKMDLLQENRYRKLRNFFGPDVFHAGMGAETVRELIANINLEQLSAELRKEISSMDSQSRKKAIRRLKVVEAFLKSSTSPEWMILTVLPVLPPDLRPMVQLDNGRFATSDLNDLYRRVINRNNRLKRLLDLGAPEIIICNEKYELQKAVDALFYNSILDEPIIGSNETVLRSLSDGITRFKPNCDTLLDMLLKRPLDYTAQTRITVEQTGDIDVAFLPENLVYHLFKPIIKQSSNFSKYRTISNSDETVLGDETILRNVNGNQDTPPFDCSKFAVLVSTDSSFSRFIALRFRLTHDLSLKVHDSLMDLLGWELLGRSARIVALFSNEAIEEALRTLAPSKLMQQKPPKVVSDLGLDIVGKKIVSFVSKEALLQEILPIGPYGWFLTTPFRYPK